MEKFIEFTDLAGIHRIVNKDYIVQLTAEMSKEGRVFTVCICNTEPLVNRAVYGYVVTEDVFNLIKAQLWTKEK